MSAIREPQFIGFDRILRNLQLVNLPNSPMIGLVKEALENSLDNFTTTFEEMIMHAEDPHPKKALRVNAKKQLTLEAIGSQRIWVKRNTICVKLKLNEWAKKNKYPRLIGDIGVSGSLQGFIITMMMKEALFEKPIVFDDYCFQFIKKPGTKELTQAFTSLLQPQYKGYMCYFSDDSCLTRFDSKGRQRIFNMDISSCDTSHGPQLFEALIKITPKNHQDEMKVLIEQLKCYIRVHNIDDRQIHLVLRALDPILFSGSTVTTLINNLASIIIGWEVMNAEFNDIEDLECAPHKVGYIVTFQECETMHDIQFLKHSPVLDSNGILRPLLNLGVFLRASGTCKGDLPGKSSDSFEDRARQFQYSLISGMYPRTNFRLKENMLKHTLFHQHEKIERRIRELLEYTVAVDPDDPPFDVSEEQLYARYRFSPDECYSVSEEFGNSGYSHFTANQALSVILKKDYDLECLNL